MHLVKVRKKVFKREFMEFRLLVVVFDIYEMTQEDENMIVSVNKVFWVFPTTKDAEIDIDMIMK